MANVTIDTLYLTGYDLLHSSESFIDELAAPEMQSIEGGYCDQFYRFNSFSGGSFSGYYGSYNSFVGGFSSYNGYNGYYNNSWC